jgi:peptide/nickel transport system permease protein
VLRRPPGQGRLVRTFRHNWAALLGAALLACMVVVAVFAPLLAPYDPLDTDLGARLRPIAIEARGDWRHPLGTDQLGRDLLTRLMYGGRVSLSIGALAVIIAGAVGVTAGLVSGYYGGLLDRVIFRLADIQLGMPFILLAITVIAVLGPSLRNLVIVLSVGGWVLYARVVRGQVLSVRRRDYVEAARALGQSDPNILLRHVLPNVITPVIVIASFAVAQNIIIESALSFLGLGAPPDVPSWGQMLADGRAYLASAWWLTTVPGLAIMLAVLSINLVGDWLQDYFDPQFEG